MFTLFGCPATRARGMMREQEERVAIRNMVRRGLVVLMFREYGQRERIEGA